MQSLLKKNNNNNNNARSDKCALQMFYSLDASVAFHFQISWAFGALRKETPQFRGAKRAVCIWSNNGSDDGNDCFWTLRPFLECNLYFLCFADPHRYFNPWGWNWSRDLLRSHENIWSCWSTYLPEKYRHTQKEHNHRFLHTVAVFLYYSCDTVTVMQLCAGFVVLFRLLFNGRRETLQQSKGPVESG